MIKFTDDIFDYIVRDEYKPKEDPVFGPIIAKAKEREGIKDERVGSLASREDIQNAINNRVKDHASETPPIYRNIQDPEKTAKEIDDMIYSISEKAKSIRREDVSWFDWPTIEWLRRAGELLDYFKEIAAKHNEDQ